MDQFPIIQAISTIPQIMPNGQPTVAIGIRLQNQAAVWGVCLPASDIELVALKRTIETVVIPAFHGRSAASFRELMNTAENLTELVRVTTINESEPMIPSSKMSRRRLISGLTVEDNPPEPVTIIETVGRPLLPAVLYGLSQAFLQTIASAKNCTTAEVIQQEYDIHLESNSLALYATVDDSTTPHLLTALSGLWYTTSGREPSKQLGNDNRRLQQYVRQLQQWLQQVGASSQTICLDLQGGLGTLYKNNIGKILGALVGLENVAKPYTLHIVDPLVGDDRPSQIAMLAELKDFLRFRRLNTQLFARTWVQTTADVDAFIEAQAAHGLQIDLSRWGSLNQVILAIQHGQAAGLPITLVTHPHETAESQQLLNQIAQVVQPTRFLIKSDFAIAYNDLMRRL